MRIVFVSDTHGRQIDDIPYGDVLVHCGDFSRGEGDLNDVWLFNTWLGTLPHTHKLVVPGNHDLACEDHESLTREILVNARLLIDEEVVIDGVSFYGTPQQPIYYNWAFNQPFDRLVGYYAMIPEHTNVLITHTPPFGYLDKVIKGYNVGSQELANALRRVKPMYHAFGHIHEGYGVASDGETTFINCSLLNEDYRATNKPIVVDVKGKNL